MNNSHKIININKESKIYSSETDKYDVVIIKLKEVEIGYFLEIDENIFNNNSESLYDNDSVYILHYFNGNRASVSFGYGLAKINNYDIKHLCNTESGSSGAPIINLTTNKILGIHKGYISNKKDNYNIGTFLKFPLNEIYNKIKQKIRPFTKEDYDNIFVRGVGLINTGNNSFINSSLQALIHCKLFIHTFMNKGGGLDSEKTPISYNVLLVCTSLLDVDKNPGVKYIDISYFNNVLIKKHPIFRNYNLPDSQELCKIFLEDLSNELNEAKNINLQTFFGIKKIQVDSIFDSNFRREKKSIIIDLFYSQIINIFLCG